MFQNLFVYQEPSVLFPTSTSPQICRMLVMYRVLKAIKRDLIFYVQNFFFLKNFKMSQNPQKAFLRKSALLSGYQWTFDSFIVNLSICNTFHKGQDVEKSEYCFS